jgi:hypothetical protein
LFTETIISLVYSLAVVKKIVCYVVADIPENAAAVCQQGSIPVEI